MAIALDNSQCPNVNIGHTRLFVYNASGNLCATYDYVDAHAVASALLPLEVGHYTIAVIINADETPAETATLTALHEWVAAQEGLDPDLLSSIADVDVAEWRIIRVTLPLTRGDFSLPVLSVRFHIPTDRHGRLYPDANQSPCSRSRLYAALCGGSLQGGDCPSGSTQGGHTRTASRRYLPVGTSTVGRQLRPASLGRLCPY
ncbi:hypothetical protein NXV01_13835 [Bacteroides sp. BFG-606]|nr:hypothetical protein [Bacteroides sp. BFG-606]